MFFFLSLFSLTAKAQCNTRPAGFCSFTGGEVITDDCDGDNVGDLTCFLGDRVILQISSAQNCQIITFPAGVTRGGCQSANNNQGGGNGNGGGNNSNTGNTVYVKATETTGLCPTGTERITTPAECEAAAMDLMEPDTGAEVRDWNWPNIPPGCWVYNNQLHFNSDDLPNWNGNNGFVYPICKQQGNANFGGNGGNTRGPDASCIAVGYGLAGNDIGNVAGTQSALDCQGHCQANSNCEWWSWLSSTDVCELKSAHGTPFLNPNAAFGPKECPTYDMPDTNKIICPYLSTLINEGALPVRDSYSKFELESITVQSGVPEEVGADHTHGGNFIFNPSGVQDIFDMEGAVNEHITSTGIHDCATDYSGCPQSTMYDPNGNEKCPGAVTPNPNCQLPNANIFDNFFAHTDANADGFITLAEMQGDANGFNPVVDENRVTGTGTIGESISTVIHLMGVDANGNHGHFDQNDRMDRASMRKLFIDRRFPDVYSFSYIAGGDGFIQLGDWRMGPVANDNYFSFCHRDSDSSVIYRYDGVQSIGGGRNFCNWDEDLAVGNMPQNVQFGSHLTFGTWRVGNLDNQFAGLAKNGPSNNAYWRADGTAHGVHPQGLRLWQQNNSEKAYFGDRFIQLGNFRFADVDGERFSISHAAFRDQGITFLENGQVEVGSLNYASDVWSRPVQGTCLGTTCEIM